MPVMCGSIFASKTFTGIVPVTGTVKLPVMLQCGQGGDKSSPGAGRGSGGHGVNKVLKSDAHPHPSRTHTRHPLANEMSSENDMR